MAERLSRSFVVNRAFVADRWLSANCGVSIAEATEDQIRRFLQSVPTAMRDQTWQALAAYGDDLVRQGRAERNVARGVGMLR